MTFQAILLAALALAPVSKAEERVFNVEGRKMTGSNRSVCIIDGEWSDGVNFHYQAWDACKNLTIEQVQAKPTAETVEQVHGIDRTFIIPAGRDGLIVGNKNSRVWLFRDEAGRVEEILISD